MYVSRAPRRLAAADFEACFLRLIEKITNGCVIEINETGPATPAPTPSRALPRARLARASMITPYWHIMRKPARAMQTAPADDDTTPY